MSDRLCPLEEAARQAPRDIAIASRDGPLSYAELDQMASDWAKRLSRGEVGKGDRIALLYPPSPECIALFFAIWRCGASFCPLSLRLPPEQIPPTLSLLSPKLFLAPTRIEQCAAAEKIDIPPSALLFTSGSSGNPKIAILSRESLLENGAAAAIALDLRPKDRWLLSLPLYHVGGIGLVLRCILARAAIAFDERDAAITHLSYVPTHLYRATPVYKQLKCLLLGGAPIASYPEKLPVYVTYGLTEMGSIVAAKKRPEIQNGRCYLGSPLPGRDVRLSAEGEIWAKGKTVFQGYWRGGEIERPFDKEGWFATGDLGEIDRQRGLAIIGRKDWMFISGGENIQPEEIEAALLEIPDILEAAVAPVDDAEFGRRPVALVKMSRPESFDVSAMRRALSTKLPKYKIPIAFLCVEEIPKKGLKADRKKIFEIIDQRGT